MRIRAATTADHDAIAAILLPVFRAGDTYAMERDVDAAGALAYWDNAAKLVTKTAGSNLLIGAFTRDCLAADATCVVRLNGVAA